ncbi:MAG: tetratricopeptide repeat protein [Deltaproteobacteria bacterium]|nr:tetratricopeptide repeat protein [Deltaproteobacteria bacterium]
MASEKRLALLEAMVADGKADAFVWYGLAMEYAGFGRVDEAIATFTTLRERDPGYVPTYLMCGQLLVKASRPDEARAWFSVGLDKARASGNDHAASEIESALAAL